MSDGITFNTQVEANKFKKEKADQGIPITIQKQGDKYKAFFSSKVYRGLVPGNEDAQLGNWFTTDKDEAEFYKKYKEKRTGKYETGKVMEENVILNNPFIVTDKNNPESPYDSFLSVSDKIPELKEIVNRDTKLEKEPGDFIVEGEKLIIDYAKKYGYDGVVFYGKDVVKF
jgi:hypothetical protein